MANPTIRKSKIPGLGMIGTLVWVCSCNHPMPSVRLGPKTCVCTETVNQRGEIFSDCKKGRHT